MRAVRYAVAALVFGIGGGAAGAQGVPLGAAPADAPASSSAPASPSAPADADAPVRVRWRPRTIEVEIPAERSVGAQAALWTVTGAGVLAGALGLYFHLDARAAQRDVEADRFLGEPWTQAQVALVERTERSSVRAGACYGVGGALLLGAMIAYIATDPKPGHAVIQTTSGAPTVTLARGGAVLGGAWRF